MYVASYQREIIRGKEDPTKKLHGESALFWKGKVSPLFLYF